MARHESLRTTFGGRGRFLRQIIHDPGHQPLDVIDLRHRDDPEAALRQAVADELGRRIDPTMESLRATLWRVAEHENVLGINIHHLVTDAWSCGVIVRDLRLLLLGGLDPPAGLPEVRWQYTQFVDWQNRVLRGDEFDRHLSYWRRQLAGARLPSLPLNPSGVAERRTASESICIEPRIVLALSSMARARHTTLFNLMLSVYYALVNRRTGKTDLAVASLFVNRGRPEVQNTVGFLSNMVILRTRLAEGDTFDTVVRKTHATVMDAFVYQAMPYQLLPADTVEVSTGRADDVVFQMMAEPMRPLTVGNTCLEVMIPEGIGSRFEFDLALVMRHDGLRAVLFYNQSRLDRAWASEFLSGYVSLASEVSSAMDGGLEHGSL